MCPNISPRSSKKAPSSISEIHPDYNLYFVDSYRVFYYYDVQITFAGTQMLLLFRRSKKIRTRDVRRVQRGGDTFGDDLMRIMCKGWSTSG